MCHKTKAELRNFKLTSAVDMALSSVSCSLIVVLLLTRVSTVWSEVSSLTTSTITNITRAAPVNSTVGAKATVDASSAAWQSTDSTRSPLTINTTQLASETPTYDKPIITTTNPEVHTTTVNPTPQATTDGTMPGVKPTTVPPSTTYTDNRTSRYTETYTQTSSATETDVTTEAETSVSMATTTEASETSIPSSQAPTKFQTTQKRNNEPTTPKKQNPDKPRRMKRSKFDGSLIAISVVLVILLLLVLGGIAYLILTHNKDTPLRRHGHRDSEDPEGIAPKQRSSRLPKILSVRAARKKTIKRNSNKPLPVPVDEFVERVALLHKDSDFFFATEYELIKSLSPTHEENFAHMKQNKIKNRYANILPFDHSRVKLLPTEDDPGSDYINANYLPGYKSKREFIASQGPKINTIDDFWRMIWEQNVTMIVMTTNLEEHNREKCYRYWPLDSQPVFFGDVQVHLKSESVLASYVIRLFDLKIGAKVRQVKQMHFMKWPDFGCPENSQLLLDFIRDVNSHQDHDSQGPIVVHCSAGVGRTGTFIALDTLLKHIEEHDTLDVFDLVLQLRNFRPNMVQSEAQYIFIHDCLRDHILKRNTADYMDDEGTEDEQSEPENQDDNDGEPLVLDESSTEL